MAAESVPHTVLWDDQQSAGERLDAEAMMRRLAMVLEGEFRKRTFRDEPVYEVSRVYAGEIELRVQAGHIYDTREQMSLAVELHDLDASRLLASYHLAGGLERVKAAPGTAWLRTANGTVLILGGGMGGILEVQN